MPGVAARGDALFFALFDFFTGWSLGLPWSVLGADEIDEDVECFGFVSFVSFSRFT